MRYVQTANLRDLCDRSKAGYGTRRLQTLRLASNEPFGAPTLYNIKEHNNLILEAIRRPLHLQISSCEILAL